MESWHRTSIPVRAPPCQRSVHLQHFPYYYWKPGHHTILHNLTVTIAITHAYSNTAQLYLEYYCCTTIAITSQAQHTNVSLEIKFHSNDDIVESRPRSQRSDTHVKLKRQTTTTEPATSCKTSTDRLWTLSIIKLHTPNSMHSLWSNGIQVAPRVRKLRDV
jgi:hypothetical protein